VDEPLARENPCSIQEMLGCEDVVANIGLEALAPTRAHSRLCRQVENDIAVGEELVQLAPRQVDRHEVELLPAPGPLQVAQLLPARVVAVEAVDADDLAAVFEQRFGQVRSDESGAAGHEGTSHLAMIGAV